MVLPLTRKETRFQFGPAIASPIWTPGVSKDTECLTPATNPDLSLGTLTTRVEYQKPGFLKKLGFFCFGFIPECGFLVVAFPVQTVGESHSSGEPL